MNLPGSDNRILAQADDLRDQIRVHVAAAQFDAATEKLDTIVRLLQTEGPAYRARIPLYTNEFADLKKRKAAAGKPPAALAWAEIAGHEDVKETLEAAIALPLVQNQPSPAPHALLYGPPGTGKTQLARAFAAEFGLRFVDAGPTTIMQKYLGDSEKSLKSKFDSARELAPCVLFFDEIDNILSARTENSGGEERVKAAFFTELSDVAPGVFVFGATNRAYALDVACLRRFPLRLPVGLPGVRARAQIIAANLPAAHSVSQKHIEDLARRCDGMSGGEIASAVKAAQLKPNRDIVRATHFISTPAGLVPCAPGTSGAEQGAWRALKDRLAPRLLAPDDIEFAAPLMSSSQVEQYMRIKSL